METFMSFGIDFIIRKCKSDKLKANIFVRITVDGLRKELSVKEQILIEDWDGPKEVVRRKSLEVKKINSYIVSHRRTPSLLYRFGGIVLR